MMLFWPRRKFFLPSFIYGRNINFPSRLSYRHREGVFFASEKCFYLLRKHFTICDQIKCFICCGRLLILFHCVSYSPLGSTSRTFLLAIVLKCFWKVFVHFQGYGFLWVALCVWRWWRILRWSQISDQRRIKSAPTFFSLDNSHCSSPTFSFGDSNCSFHLSFSPWWVRKPASTPCASQLWHQYSFLHRDENIQKKLCQKNANFRLWFTLVYSPTLKKS